MEKMWTEVQALADRWRERAPTATKHSGAMLRRRATELETFYVRTAIWPELALMGGAKEESEPEMCACCPFCFSGPCEPAPYEACPGLCLCGKEETDGV